MTPQPSHVTPWTLADLALLSDVVRNANRVANVARALAQAANAAQTSPNRASDGERRSRP